MVGKGHWGRKDLSDLEQRSEETKGLFAKTQTPQGLLAKIASSLHNPCPIQNSQLGTHKVPRCSMA